MNGGATPVLPPDAHMAWDPFWRTLVVGWLLAAAGCLSAREASQSGEADQSGEAGQSGEADQSREAGQDTSCARGASTRCWSR
jgi:hypothetical protein